MSERDEFEHFFYEHPLRGANFQPQSTSGTSGAPTTGSEDPGRTGRTEPEIPRFPEAAWRGVFADYREAMVDATEASDVFHFGTLWARVATALGRRIRFEYGLTLFANVYLLLFGPTNDRKTTAIRKFPDLGHSETSIIRGAGSGEGVADEFSRVKPGEPVVILSEEFSGLLRRGRWEGATLIPFLTESFDCPPSYELKFRKKPVCLKEPTPTLLAATTPEWFWHDARTTDFAGGFGNRIFFLTGTRKKPNALPTKPDLRPVQQAVCALAEVPPCEVRLSPEAEELWQEFYMSWDAERERRDTLLESAVARTPAYTLKLCMAYASLERTLPAITLEQLSAAIQVGYYGVACAKELLSLQNAGTNPIRELEKGILAFVQSARSQVTTKRLIYKSLWRHYASSEQFNRAFDSLVRAGELFTKPMARGSLFVSTEPLS